MAPHRSIYIMIATLALALAGALGASAKGFTVESFRQLPNDVSAFIDPVRDLNDEDCGLIKVIASEDFAFSTPLGIVKRVDNVGEIWLYLPRGSKKITIKHPEWGVLRDYAFPTKIESHMTYELRIAEPAKPIEITVPQPIITTVIDTFVMTRVDTLVIEQPKARIPFKAAALATLTYGGRSADLSAGLMVMALKRHGGFVHISSDFGKIGPTIGKCGKDGQIDGAMPYYSGRTRHSALLFNAGAAHRVSDRVTVFEGIGYSFSNIAWELAPSEGGGYVKNTGFSVSGISAEAGVAITFGRVAISASAVTIKGKEWFGSIGIGYKFGK